MIYNENGEVINESNLVEANKLKKEIEDLKSQGIDKYNVIDVSNKSTMTLSRLLKLAGIGLALPFIDGVSGLDLGITNAIKSKFHITLSYLDLIIMAVVGVITIIISKSLDKKYVEKIKDNTFKMISMLVDYKNTLNDEKEIEEIDKRIEKLQKELSKLK